MVIPFAFISSNALAGFRRIQGRRLHAVIRGDAVDDEFLDASFFQEAIHLRPGPAVVLKTRVAVVSPVFSLFHDGIKKRLIEKQFGVLGALDAVRRPEHLFFVSDIDHVEWLPAGMIRVK